MIVDHISNSQKYLMLHPLFEEAFSLLEERKVTKERTDLYTIGARKGNSKEEKKLEVHSKFMDIHLTVKGTEMIGLRSGCLHGNGYNTADDYELFDDKAESMLVLHEGYFAVFYPGEAHAPFSGEAEAEKIIAKVRA